MKKLILIIVTVLSCFSCQNKSALQQAALADQMADIVAVHDELMPQMGVIGTLMGQLQEQVAIDSTLVAHSDAITQLKGANKAMMTWMMDLSEVFTPDQIMGQDTIPVLLHAQVGAFERSAQELRVQMMTAIDQAQALSKEK